MGVSENWGPGPKDPQIRCPYFLETPISSEFLVRVCALGL